MKKVNMQDLFDKLTMIYGDECEKNVVGMILYNNDGKFFFDSESKNQASDEEVEALLLRGAVVDRGGKYYRPSSFNSEKVSFSDAVVNPEDIEVDLSGYATKEYVDEQIANAELGANTENKVVDLIIFMGQSNMAGRGVASQAPMVPEGHGYEFRAMSDPTKLYPIVEPFGVNENNSSSGVTENLKTGSMVSSFVNAYYKYAGVPVVAVSCSKGGTVSEFWMPNNAPLNDAISRYNRAKEWLIENGYSIRREFMVWCQGESDAARGVTAQTWINNTKAIIEEMKNSTGLEACFVVRIGHHTTGNEMFATILQATNTLCKEYDSAILVSTLAVSFVEKNMMKDECHYLQEGYNLIGNESGTFSAYFANTGIKPYMYDPENDNVYFPQGDIGSGSNEDMVEEIDSINNTIKVLEERITLLELSSGANYYAVEYKLNGVTSSSNVGLALENARYTTTLEPTSIYVKEMDVNITMGGIDVTSSVYSDGVINIDKVTEKVVITATASSVEEIEFTFNSNNEYGVNLASVGTISDGKLNVPTESDLLLAEPITFSPNQSFTIEGIIDATYALVLGAGSSTGGFILLPNENSKTFRLRDIKNTMTVNFTNTTYGDDKTHYAIVYDSYEKTFTGYINGVEVATTYATGSANTFNGWTATHLFGGYTAVEGSNVPFHFSGDVWYLRITFDALTTNLFHIE